MQVTERKFGNMLKEYLNVYQSIQFCIKKENNK